MTNAERRAALLKAMPLNAWLTTGSVAIAANVSLEDARAMLGALHLEGGDLDYRTSDRGRIYEWKRTR